MHRFAPRAVLARAVIAAGLCWGGALDAAEPGYGLLSSHLAGSTYLSAADPAAPMRVAPVLQLTDPAGAAAFAEAVSTPGNPLRGHYLTPARFTARFGTAPATIDMVPAWVAVHRLTAARPPAVRR